MRKRSLAIPMAAVVGASFTLALYAASRQDPARPADAPGDARKKSAPPMPDGPGFGPGMFLAPLIFEVADSDKDGRLTIAEARKFAEQFIRDADAEKKGSIDAGSLGLAMNRRMAPPGDGPDPGGPPGGFGPGTFLGPQIVEAADADKDGRISPEEASKATERFLREADSKQTGSVDSDALAGAMNRRMGPPPGFGGPGGPMGAERKLVKDYDKDGNGRLNKEERLAARQALKVEREKNPRGGPGMFGGGPPGFGGAEEPAKPGPHVDPADVKAFPGKQLYDPTVLRTVFLEFEDRDWESAMTEFHGTDVELPATLTVDGKRYPDVGLHFRGLSSYMGVRQGHKRSLNVSIDFAHPDQRLEGYKTLNLLNAHEDPTFLHTVLYFHIARNYIPAPKANFVRMVVNGESWGVYVNAQQFDKVLIAENYAGTGGKGARWKVRGNPGADGGLRYVGDDVAEYKKRFEIKSGDDKDWKALIALCKALDQTAPDRLEEALKPVLDIEGALWFLALDNALINGDGYWTRASDYSIYRDPAGKFHVLPHDANETFGPAMMFGPGGPGRGGPRGPGGGPGRGTGGPGGGPGGPGGGPGGPGGGPGGPGGGPGRGPGMGPQKVDLDPLIGLDDARMPLRSKLLAVPSLKARYLGHVRSIAVEWLDWSKLGPIVARYRDLIEKDIEADTRKLSSFAAFQKSVADSTGVAPAPRGREGMSLRDFADQRRKYLLDHAEVKKVAP